MIKLIIQIPCFNEEKTLPKTYADLPKKIEGVDCIETLIINDGSTDKTLLVAEQLGINHIVNNTKNRGLAYSFEAGIKKSLELGADIIVNTDGDNQYFGEDIVNLIKPILEGRADVVIGDRQTSKIKHFSWLKKIMQRLGSAFVRRLSKTQVRDAVSGFRAYSRETAMKINIITDFSYTIENLIQLGNRKMKIISVPVRTNSKERESRLFKNLPHFIGNQMITIIRAYSTYRALKIFSLLGFLLITPGLIGFIRFLFFYFTGEGEGHIQSLIFSTSFIIVGFLLLVLGIIADLISTNRKLIEKLTELYKEDKWKHKKEDTQN